MKRHLPLIAFAALALLFVIGAAQLYSLRLKRGDVYPPLSSLRADPLGAKVLHDALSHLADRDGSPHIQRNYAPLDELENTPPVTLLYLGATWDDSIKPALQSAREGNRIVITFQPILKASQEKQTETDKKRASAKKRKEAKKAKTSEPSFSSFSAAEELTALGLRLRREKQWLESGVSSATATQKGLEPELKWVGTAALEIIPEKAKQITILYEREGHPVMVELPIGRGSIVVATDSYFLSNEALYKERPPQLIAHLLGHASRIVFDEVHHNVQEQRGIAWLIREHRLFGMVFVLLLLALLYLWKEAMPLLPPREDTGDTEEESSESPSGGGMVLLLRRSIPSSRIVTTCVDEWNKTFSHQHAPIPPPAKGHDPVAEYTRISHTLPKKMR